MTEKISTHFTNTKVLFVKTLHLNLKRIYMDSVTKIEQVCMYILDNYHTS